VKSDKKKRPIVHVLPVRKQDRTWAWNNKEKTDVFAEHLERTFQPNEEKTLVNSRRGVKTPIYLIPPIKVKQSRYRPGVAQRVPGS